jgi:HAD superfamily hydrolase (TIGR01509 family)
MKALVFDLDGTLLDSFLEGRRRFVKICTRNGLKCDEEAKQRAWKIWGSPGVPLLMEIFGISSDFAHDIYKQWEIEDATDPIPLINGTLDTLNWAKSLGMKILMLTSRHRENTLHILRHHEIFNFFDYISARCDTKHHKPDPRAFEKVLVELEKFKIKKHETLFVGDTIADVRSGLGVDIRTVIVRTGPYSMEVVPEGLVPDCDIIQSVLHLPKWLLRIKSKFIAHHDDPPCEHRLSPDGFCEKCQLYPDTQSKSLWYYCPTCDVPLEKMACPMCKWVLEKPTF